MKEDRLGILIREKIGSIKTFAQRCGITERSIKHYREGVVPRDLRRIETMATVLGVPVQEIRALFEIS